MKRLFSHLLLPAVLFLAGSSAFAQLDTGTISGAVTDVTGDPVPNVKVVLRNELTSALREVVANSQGYYTFPVIPSGRYTVQVEQQGFKSYQRTGLILQVNQNLNVPITLELGALSESVTVTGAPPLVDSSSGVLRETVDHTRITELPLNGRNVLQLQSLLPGAVATGSLDQGANTPGFAINGGIGSANNSASAALYLPHADGMFPLTSHCSALIWRTRRLGLMRSAIGRHWRWLAASCASAPWK
jgi:hypothetical protein